MFAQGLPKTKKKGHEMLAQGLPKTKKKGTRNVSPLLLQTLHSLSAAEQEDSCITKGWLLVVIKQT